MHQAQDPLLTTGETAAKLRLAPETLRVWRWQGVGPAWVKVGRQVLYRLSEVERWIDDRTHQRVG